MTLRPYRPGTAWLSLGLLLTLGAALWRAVIRFETRMRALEARIGNGNPTPLGQRLAVLEGQVGDLWRWFTSRVERRQPPAPDRPPERPQSP